MCRYAEAAQACDAAARRAEYTARQSSKLAHRIGDERSQTHREAEALVDEWVAVRDGLATATDILTLISQHPSEFEAFRQSLAPSALPPARAQVPFRASMPVSEPARALLKAALRF